MFRRPVARFTAWETDAVEGCFEAMDSARADGLWLAGYASYELGYALEPRLVPHLPPERRVPLICFAAFERPEPQEAVDEWFRRATEAQALATVSVPEPAWSIDTYRQRFERVKGWIAAGDFYQANLTFPMRCRIAGPPAGLFARLKKVQPVEKSVFADLGEGPVVLSRSPELFFKTDGKGRIETRPIKGTAPRDLDPARDRAVALELAGDEKNRAENLMIVDLMRNDLSCISEVGTVKVPELFKIESYETVHQMVSRVTAGLLPGIAIGHLFHALFPCGSVTGAPKIRAMEAIRELEDAPRNAYCGSLGWFAPDGSASANVAIRTISVYADGEAEFNVGGGVVYDSTAEGEYEECLWKARFVTRVAGPRS